MLNPCPCRHDGPMASMCHHGLPYPPAFAASILSSTLLLINQLFKNNFRLTEKLSQEYREYPYRLASLLSDVQLRLLVSVCGWRAHLTAD